MRQRRAHEAWSAADRDLQRHLGKAEAAIRAALDVCLRADRSEEEPRYRNVSEQLKRAERLLAGLGHFGEIPPETDVQTEARALLAWLDGRARGTRRPRRTGQVYQDSLKQVLAFLNTKPQSPLDDIPQERKRRGHFSPPPPSVDYGPDE